MVVNLSQTAEVMNFGTGTGSSIYSMSFARTSNDENKFHNDTGN